MKTRNPRKKCPGCESFRTQRMGMLRTKKSLLRRYRCTECGQTFSRPKE